MQQLNNSQIEETIQISIKRSKDKQILVNSYNGVLLNNQKKQPVTHAPTWMNLRIITLSERKLMKRLHPMWFHLYDIWEKATLQGQKTFQWLSGSMHEVRGQPVKDPPGGKF